jgi:hypothetical protein
LRTINEIPVLLSGKEKKDRFNGVVFFPGEDTVLALKRAAALLPVEFTIYSSGAAVEEIQSRLGNARYEFGQTEDPVAELSQYLSGKRPGNGNPCHFIVRGDLLPLETTYRAISVANSAENIPGVASEVLPAEPKVERLFLSHVALLDVPVLARVLVISDGFVNPGPDIKTRLAIIRNGLTVCDAIGIDLPRVALLAAVEQVYPGMPVTVESADIAKMCKAGEITRAYVDGPLSFDVALVEQVAKEKGATGEVAGRADLLVGSSIAVVNGIYMAQTVFARANAASVVVGGKVPLALPFPSDCIDNIFFSICLACLLSSHDLPSTD